VSLSKGSGVEDNPFVVAKAIDVKEKLCSQCTKINTDVDREN
jgi:hypothetical protein